ncbi:MAG TPA: DUF4386 domain-containing protein [Actinomycetes bacterium]
MNGTVTGSHADEVQADRPVWGTRSKRLAAIAGVLYLLVGVFGGFAQGFVSPKVYVAGDAAATAGNLVAHSGLVRAAVVADLFQTTLWVLLALTLYRLLKHVNTNAARVMVVLVAVGAGITCLNAVFEFEALRAATGAVDLSSLGPAGCNALILLLVDTQHYGLLTAQIFFGLWLVPLGYLAYRSSWFAKALGVLLVVGGACYLADMLAAFLLPDLDPKIHTVIVIPCAVAEIWMVGHLLYLGVRKVKADDPGQVDPPTAH